MILKIYLGISILATILSFLMTKSMIKKYENIIDKNSNIYDKLNAYLTMIIKCFIPIYHLFIIIGMLFCYNESINKIDKSVSEYIKK